MNTKERFSSEEDNKLIELVAQHGTISWDTIAGFMSGRTPYQCRERWKKYLNLDLNKNEWTKEEDLILLDLVSEYGKTWSKFVPFLNGRSDVTIRNRFRKLLRNQKKEEQNQFHCLFLPSDFELAFEDFEFEYYYEIQHLHSNLNSDDEMKSLKNSFDHSDLTDCK
jgi:hypothetical protein